MNLSQNISYLRKKNNWSQEELAHKLGVSRQAVSKWESGTSQPDLEKILKMSTFFNVSTDTLLKEDLEDEEEEEIIFLEKSDNNQIDPFPSSFSTLSQNETLLNLEKEDSDGFSFLSNQEESNDNTFTFLNSSQENNSEETTNLSNERFVSLKMVKEYLEWSSKYANLMSVGVFLCIVSPAPLLILLGFLVPTFGLEEVAAGLGVSLLLILVAMAVGLFIHLSSQAKKWEWLTKESFNLDPSAHETLLSAQKEDQKNESLQIALGVVLCVISPIPLILGALLLPEGVIPTMVGFLLLLVALGVFLLVYTSLHKKSYMVLLEQGEYTPLKKKQSQFEDAIGKVYWIVVTIIYLIWSFLTDNWDTTWIIWPIAGIGFGLFTKLIGPNGLLQSKKEA